MFDIWTANPLLVFLELSIAGLILAGMGAIFQKADYPSWYVVVPILNYGVVFRIAQMSPLSMLYFVLPFLGVMYWPMICISIITIPLGLIAHMRAMFSISKRFGQSDLFALGMTFLPFIFIPMLGFGSARLMDRPRRPADEFVFGED